MSLGDYLFYSVVGICVVFATLFTLMLLIKLLMAVSDGAKEAKGAGAAGADGALSGAAAITAGAGFSDAPLAPGTAGDLRLYDTDPRDAAMVMAIVANKLNKPLNELRFISIREVK